MPRLCDLRGKNLLPVRLTKHLLPAPFIRTPHPIRTVLLSYQLYLQSVNQPQVFGTQYPGDKSAENTPKPQVDPRVLDIQRTQQPYNSKLLPDAVRQDFCVPDLSQQEKNLAIFNTGHRPEGKLTRALFALTSLWFLGAPPADHQILCGNRPIGKLKLKTSFEKATGNDASTLENQLSFGA
jgi:hypothetical protein